MEPDQLTSPRRQPAGSATSILVKLAFLIAAIGYSLASTPSVKAADPPTITAAKVSDATDDPETNGNVAQRSTPLSMAAVRVADALADDRVKLDSYKRDLAWEGLLRWAEVSGRDRLLQQVKQATAEHGLNAATANRFGRGPFNCLLYWMSLESDQPEWLNAFERQTREYRAQVHRSPEGAIEHPRGARRGGGHAMLIDALQDYASRMAMLGQTTGDPAYFREAVDQFRIYRAIVRDPATGLWSQGRGWLDEPKTLSPGAWSRGHGWLIRGMVDTLILMPPDSNEAAELRGYLRELGDALIQVQQPDGMWHCLLHRPPRESPPETSGTALIAGNLAVAVAEGFLESERYAKAAELAFKALPQYVDDDGVVLSVSPGPGPLFEVEPWAVERFPPGDQHGPFAIFFAALGQDSLRRMSPVAD